MIETRYATDSQTVKRLDTEGIRKAFLIETLFINDNFHFTYSHYDRLMIGGVKPVSKSLTLPNYDNLKANYFLERRELGVINVGGTGVVTVDGTPYTLDRKDALYVGKGAKNVAFSSEGTTPALFYLNAAPAHAAYPSKRITLADAETVSLGSLETANERTIRKLIVNSVVKTCQLQMGMTELKTGSVWNTMPAHTHDRRMEAYFYFDIPDKQVVCHFMGEPRETRHLFVKNHQAIISPPWSIHSGAGTSNYTFIWGMAGENLDYGDMDTVTPDELR